MAQGTTASKPSAHFIKDAVFLVDCSSYIFRAYYAIGADLKAPDGTPTHATYGFLQMLQSLLAEYSVRRVVLVWDSRGPGFRHELFEAYKANRTAPPEDLGIQIENAKKAAELLGFPNLECPGFEADDILATLVRKNPETHFVISTGDKDLLQLVGPEVWCLDTLKMKWSNIKEAHEKFGVEPERIRDVQALCGDSVDNIPGVPGVGPKTAMALVQHFGSLEKVLAEAQRRWADPALRKLKDDPLKGKCLESVATNIDKAKISLELVTLSDKAPVETHVDTFERKAPQDVPFKDFAKKLGFTRLIERMLILAEAEGGVAGPAPAAAMGIAPETLLPKSADFSVHTISSVKDFAKLLESHEDAPHAAFDTETLSLDRYKPGNLVGMSLSFSPSEGYYLPLRHEDSSAWHDGEEGVREALNLWQMYLESRPPRFALYMQNAKFDWHILVSEGFEWPTKLRIDDSMVMSFVLDPSEKHGMDALATKYLGYETLKFEDALQGAKNFSQVPTERATFYAAEDAVVTLKLGKVLSEKLHEQKLWKVYEELDRPLITVLCAMEREGIMLDMPILHELSQAWHEELTAIEAKGIELLRSYGVDLAEDFNLGSPKQIAKVLFEDLKLPVLKSGKTGPSTDISVLEELSLQHPFPKILVEFREVAKLLSTYVDALPLLVNEKTARVHTDFSQVVAATGRLASSNPNLQNIPIRTERGRRIRDAFKAKEGCVLLGVDYSQIELRVLAHMTGDRELTRAFQENADIHRRTAALVLGKPEKNVSDDERRTAKAINFGIVYGQTAFGLAKALGIPRAQAQQFIDNYFKTYPGIKEYMARAKAEAKEHGYVSTLSGRRRPLPEIHSKNAMLRQFGERMAINSPVQGTAADMMKVAMLHAYARAQQELPSARLLLQVHDELVFEVASADANRLKTLVVESLEDPKLLSSFGVDKFAVTMRADAHIGTHWGEL